MAQSGRTGLANAPGIWRWEDRGERGWWRVHDELGIVDGPHDQPWEPQPLVIRERTHGEKLAYLAGYAAALETVGRIGPKNAVKALELISTSLDHVPGPGEVADAGA